MYRKCLIDRTKSPEPGTFFDYQLHAWGRGMCCSDYAVKGYSMPFLTPQAGRAIADAMFLDRVTLADGRKFVSIKNQVTRITAVQHPESPYPASTQYPVRRTVDINGVEHTPSLRHSPFCDPRSIRLSQSITYVDHPAFIIDVRMILLPIFYERVEREKNLKGYEAQVLRKIERGTPWKDVYFGKHRFPCFIGSVGTHKVIDYNADLGLIAYDTDYNEITKQKLEQWLVQGVVQHGVLDCAWPQVKLLPASLSREEA